MNALEPRSVALQGFGFVPRLVAVQGLWPTATEPEPPQEQTLGGGQRLARRKPHRDEDVLLFIL